MTLARASWTGADADACLEGPGVTLGSPGTIQGPTAVETSGNGFWLMVTEKGPLLGDTNVAMPGKEMVVLVVGILNPLWRGCHDACQKDKRSEI